jgi:hypothetical protein
MNVRRALPFALISLAIGCGDATTDAPGNLDVAPAAFNKGVDDKGDASAVAVFLDFEYSGELLTDRTYNLEKQVEEQMLYTIGHLNGDNSVGRLDKLVVSNLESERTESGLTRVTYDASLLVAWGDKVNVPSTYTFRLPHDVSFAGQEAFADAYSETCVDFGAHDVTAGSMWYYYRPEAWRCELAAEDVIEIEATLSVSPVNTTGKYPEYHKVWEDDALEVVAVFGKYKDGATSSSDAGIRAYNRFVAVMQNEFEGLDEVSTEPADLSSSPGIEQPDVTFRATMADGSKVEVVALLVDNVRTAPRSFTERYEGLSGDADLIVYNGHAGLGANIRALAQKGRWEPGQYSIVFMNGCDTYAYVDSALNDARAAVNPDDPEGTKYLDIITNAMPSFFHEMPNSTLQLIRGLMSIDDPRTYEQMFEKIDADEVVLVSGEQDNVYVPGYGEDTDGVVTSWDGMEAGGTVEADAEDRFATETLAAGTYLFEMVGDGDADLYVRVGAEPTTEAYDCRPFRWGSEESCLVELNSPAPIHVMVRGWEASSNYRVTGLAQ